MGVMNSVYTEDGWGPATLAFQYGESTPKKTINHNKHLEKETTKKESFQITTIIFEKSKISKKSIQEK